MGFHVICTESPGSGSRRALVLFPTLQWGRHLTLSQVFTSYSLPSSVLLHSAHSLVSLHPVTVSLFVGSGGSGLIPPGFHTHGCVAIGVLESLPICQVPVHLHANVSSLLFPTTNLFGGHCDLASFYKRENQVPLLAQGHTASRGRSQDPRPSSLTSKPHP